MLKARKEKKGKGREGKGKKRKKGKKDLWREGRRPEVYRLKL